MQAAHSQKAVECYAFYSLSQPVAVAQEFYCKTVLLFKSKEDFLKAGALNRLQFSWLWSSDQGKNIQMSVNIIMIIRKLRYCIDDFSLKTVS